MVKKAAVSRKTPSKGKKVSTPKKTVISKQKGKALDLTITGTKILDLPTYQDVADAHKRITGVAHKTPVMTSRTINKQTGAKIFFKCENF
jgi:hypothetical protein